MAQEQGLQVDREGFTRLMQEQRQRAKADAKSKKCGHAQHRGVARPAGAGRDRLPRLPRAHQRGDGRRPGRRRRARQRDRARPARPGRARPHPVLRGVRRPDRRRGRHHRRRRAPEGRRRAAPGQGPHRAHRRGASPVRCAPARRCSPRSTPSGASRPARRTPAPTSCTRRCARCSARRPCSPAPTTSPATCASTSRGARRSRRPPAARSRRSPTSRSARTCRCRPPTCRCRRPARSARSRCSARPTARTCASSRSAARGAASCAVAPTCSTPARSARSPSPASRRSGSGVRRVEAFVGMEALRYLAKERAIVAELTGLVGARPDELAERVGAMVTRLKDAERELERARREQVQAAAGNLTEQARDVNGVTYLGHDAGEAGADDVRTMVLDLRNRLGAERPSVVAITGAAKGRPVVVVATNEPARARGIRAGELVRVAATALGGGGGGKDDIAQGGGQDAVQGRRRARGGRVARRGARRLMPDPRERGARLGVDVGSVRVGVAVSDPDGILATPVATVARTARGRAGPRRLRRRGDRRAGARARGGRASWSGCPDRSPGTKAPLRPGRASMLPWWRRASRRSGSVSSTSDSPVSMRTARSVRAGSPAGGSAPWSTRPPPCSSCRRPSTRSAAPAPLPGSRSDQDGASRGRRTRGRDPAARLHRDDLR